MAMINRITKVPRLHTDDARPKLRDIIAEMRTYPQVVGLFDFDERRVVLDTVSLPGSVRIEGVRNLGNLGGVFTTASETKRPVWDPLGLNDRPVAVFDHVAGNRLDGIGLYPASGDHTKIIVSKLTAPTGVRLICGTNSPAETGHMLTHNTAGSGGARMFLRNGLASPQMAPTIGTRENDWTTYIASQDVAGEKAYLKVGDLDVVEATMVAPDSSPNVYLGQTPGGAQNFGGPMAGGIILACQYFAPAWATLRSIIAEYQRDAFGAL